MNRAPDPIPVTDPVALGAAIRARRKQDGLTLAETAGLTDVGIRFLSELENGKPTVRLDKLLTVMKALGLALYLAPADLDTLPADRTER